MSAQREQFYTACPHDCPSTCALQVEKLENGRVGKVRGATDNTYTAGVICSKVARYAERIHHPDRLMSPLRRTGSKGSREFEPLSWDDALDEVAAAFVAGPVIRNTSAAPGETPLVMSAAAMGTDAVAQT